MVEQGEPAPAFELPAVSDGDVGRMALDDYESTIVVLAFYPGDFNPACDAMSTGLDDLDLFTMQKDVEVLAVSGDSVFSHRAFADEYDLQIPLLSDRWGEVAEAYDVAADDERYRTRRAVFVVDHTGRVEYAWVADDLEELPDVDEIRAVVENISDDELAHARYREGYDRYVEGLETFETAMAAYEEHEWREADRTFEAAAGGFDGAYEAFDTAVRFAEDAAARRCFERAGRKAESLWRAADWLADSASNFASGEGGQGQALREDAETPLSAARELPDPPEPGAVPSEEDEPHDPGSGDETDLQLGGIPSVEEAAGEAAGDAVPGEADSGGADGGDGGPTSAPGWETKHDAPAAAATDPSEEDAAEPTEIDDDELAAITAELEEQNDPDAGESVADPGDDPDAATVDDELDEDDLELDLVDPTEHDSGDEGDELDEGDGEGGDDDELDEGDSEGDESGEDDEDDEEGGFFGDDLGDGGHGVPDSL